MAYGDGMHPLNTVHLRRFTADGSAGVIRTSLLGCCWNWPIRAGARTLLEDLPQAKHMLADRGYDANWYRQTLENKGIIPCIPSRKSRRVPIPHNADRYKKHHKIKNNFARLKD